MKKPPPKKKKQKSVTWEQVRLSGVPGETFLIKGEKR